MNQSSFQIAFFFLKLFFKRVKETRAVVFWLGVFMPYSKIDPNIRKITPSFVGSFFSHWIKGSLSYLSQYISSLGWRTSETPVVVFTPLELFFFNPNWGYSFSKKILLHFDFQIVFPLYFFFKNGLIIQIIHSSLIFSFVWV